MSHAQNDFNETVIESVKALANAVIELRAQVKALDDRLDVFERELKAATT